MVDKTNDRGSNSNYIASSCSIPCDKRIANADWGGHGQTHGLIPWDYDWLSKPSESVLRIIVARTWSHVLKLVIWIARVPEV